MKLRRNKILLMLGLSLVTSAHEIPGRRIFLQAIWHHANGHPYTHARHAPREPSINRVAETNFANRLVNIRPCRPCLLRETVIAQPPVVARLARLHPSHVTALIEFFDYQVPTITPPALLPSSFSGRSPPALA